MNKELTVYLLITISSKRQNSQNEQIYLHVLTLQMQPLLADSLIEVIVFQEGLLHHAAKTHIKHCYKLSQTEIIKKKVNATYSKSRESKNYSYSRVCFLTSELQDRELYLPACRIQPPSWLHGGYTRYNSYCPLGGAPVRDTSNKCARELLFKVQKPTEKTNRDRHDVANLQQPHSNFPWL